MRLYRRGFIGALAGAVMAVAIDILPTFNDVHHARKFKVVHIGNSDGNHSVTFRPDPEGESMEQSIQYIGEVLRQGRRVMRRCPVHSTDRVGINCCEPPYTPSRFDITVTA